MQRTFQRRPVQADRSPRDTPQRKASLRMDWSADIEVEQTANGTFIAVLVLLPPAEIGPALRLVIGDEYAYAAVAEWAAVDALIEMATKAQR